MPKYDAFGREIGEDTLSGLGGGDSAAQATPQPVPNPSPTPPPPDGWTAGSGASVTAPPPAPQDAPPQATFTIPGGAPLPTVRRRRGTGLGCLIGLVVVAAVVAGPVIAVVSFVSDANDAIDDVTGIFDVDTATVTPSVPEPEVPAEPPTGLERGSMVLRPNFGGALKEVADRKFGGAMQIRLSPDRAAFVLVRGGKIRSVTARYDGQFVPTPAATGGSGAPTIPIAQIDPSAPARLVRAGAARYPAIKANRINYLVASPDPIERRPSLGRVLHGRHRLRGGRRARPHHPPLQVVKRQVSGCAPGTSSVASCGPGAQPRGGL